MSTIKNVELIDDVRNDALIIMKNNPEMQYDEAYEKAKQNLIGDENIKEFEFRPFQVEIDDELLSSSNEENLSDDSNQIELSDEAKENIELYNKLEPLADDFYSSIREQLKDLINVSEFDDNQIEQLYIGLRMGIDIKKIANNKFSSSQLKFLCVMLASGNNVDKYIEDVNFNPALAFAEMAQQEIEEN